MSFSQHLVIPDPSGTRVLLVDSGTGWELPRVSNEHWVLVEGAQSWVLERLGLDIVILRCVLVEHDSADEDSGDAYLLAENLGDQTPHAGSWWDEKAASMAVTEERDRAAIRWWFREEREGRPRALQPWEYPGWAAGASAWIEASLRGVTSVDQYATWSVSSVLRVETEVGRYYFKAVPPHFRHEATVTKMLADRFPAAIPRPVAIDDERGWFLTEDFGDLVGGMDEPHWEGALDALVALQRRSASYVDPLLGSGCLDRRPHMLVKHVEELALDGAEWLPTPMVKRLWDALPRLADLCRDVASSPVPDTLVHGDFHGENVAVNGGRYLIFDWTDACIAHPFFDTAIVLRDFDRASAHPTLRQRWRDRYLDGWRDLVAHEDAIDLLERTEPLAAMHQAISCRWLLDSMDPSERWQFGSALQDWVMRALDARVLSD